jgi:hypothetical protein
MPCKSSESYSSGLEFDPRSDHVGSLVDRWHWRRIFFENLGFACQISHFIDFSTFINHLTLHTNSVVEKPAKKYKYFGWMLSNSKNKYAKE